jgi:hypothetical protein
MAAIVLSYDESFSRGIFTCAPNVPAAIWIRLRAAAADMDAGASFSAETIEVDWRCALDLLRIHSKLQGELGFRFEASPSSQARIAAFMAEYRVVRAAAGTLRLEISPEEIDARLRSFGWAVPQHQLKPYQLGNLSRLLALRNGANFSVPGAGKTTVTFALHLLVRSFAQVALVVAPRNAFQAWEEVIDECLLDEADAAVREPFIPLVGGESRIAELLGYRGHRYIISYDQLVRVEHVIKEVLSTTPTHLILDESHRMKAGAATRRGSVLLRLGHLAVRRDILSGTPMPQSGLDIQSQLDFLWPGAGLGSRIAVGEPAKDVIQGLFVRTTKEQLGLEPRVRRPVPVSLTEAHLAFYCILKDGIRAQVSELRRGATGAALANARKSVVRLLQAAVNPQLVASTFSEIATPDRDGLLRAVIQEGPSARVRAAADLASELAAQGRKVLVWTIFTSTIGQLRGLLTRFEPAVIYGATGLGDESDDETRQGQIRRFKTDPRCMVMLANPAAASEGMSLHMYCHDAIYVDRSYNATHFLQSIDRIHRLGLPSGTTTNIHVLENKLPIGVGSIDVSVARRLAKKIRGMEQLLADPDLHELALDEEDVEGALEDTISTEDIDDLISELEGARTAVGDDDIV